MKNKLFTLFLALLSVLPAWAENICFTATTTNVWVELQKVGNPNPVTIKYSNSDQNANDNYTIGTRVKVGSGKKIWFRGEGNQNHNYKPTIDGVQVNQNFSKGEDGYYRFAFFNSATATAEITTGCVAVTGDLYSIYGDGNNPPSYYKLFYNCKAITSFANSPVYNQSMTVSSYESLFEGCSNLTSVPNFSANDINVAKNGFKNMFKGCEKLVTAPNWQSASTLSESCYEGMFEGCKMLKNLPRKDQNKGGFIAGNGGSFPTLAKSCFKNMFSGCTALEYGPLLYPEQNAASMALADSCFKGMFSGCTSLQAAPDLPATTLKDYCYANMFEGCISLKTAPELPAASLANRKGCYKMMFADCANLSFISVSFTDWNEATIIQGQENAEDTENTAEWVKGVAPKGVFMGPEDLIGFPIFNDSHIPEGWSTTLPDYLCFTGTGNDSDNRVRLRRNGTPDSDKMAYKKEGDALWTIKETKDIQSVQLKRGEKCYFRAIGTDCELGRKIGSNIGYYDFYMENGKVSVSGNIMSLLDNTMAKKEAPAYAFYKLFSGLGANLTDISELKLPATTLGEHCYEEMFKGCSVITVAPNLPSTSLANSCYKNMFYGCSNLYSAPELPAETLAESCYEGMFQNCALLSVAPFLRARELKTNCYKNMFNGCGKLSYLKVAFYMNKKISDGIYNNYLSDWVKDVPMNGDFIAPAELMASVGNSHFGASKAPQTQQHKWVVWELDGQDYLTFVVSKGNNAKIRIRKVGTIDNFRGLEYYTGNNTSKGFQDVTFKNGVFEISLTASGAHVSFRAKSKASGNGNNVTDNAANKTFYKDDKNYYRFEVDANEACVDVKGDLTSIMHNYCKLRVFEKENALRNLFENCVNIISAPDLPATTLTKNCYASIFKGCTGLLRTPNMANATLADGCYANMFENCTELMFADDLPSTTVKPNCYREMFKGCKNLQKATSLPATSLSGADGCYQGMFQGCTSLKVAPELNANVLAVECYKDMFNGCDNLVSVSELPAKYLTANCYEGMFSGCKKLANKVDLNSTSLAEECYKDMFNGCLALNRVPELPATTLANGCYQGMFKDCKAIQSAPDLNATYLTENCYASMFMGCTSLSFIKVNFLDWREDINSTRLWVDNVALKGTFVCNPELNDSPFDADHKPYNDANPWDVVNDFLCFTANQKGTTVQFYIPEGNPNKVQLEYHQTAVNDLAANGDWPAYTGQTIKLENPGDRVFFRAKKGVTNATINNSTTANKYKDGENYHFVISGKYVSVSGELISLLTQDYQITQRKQNGASYQVPEYAFNGIFYNCQTLYDASQLKLSAPRMSGYSYARMFQNCTQLTKAPKLPATTLYSACYQSMFSGCSNLSEAPELPAKVASYYCYQYMFYKCTALKKAPELPATTLRSYCYHSMFWGCSSLTKAPKLPATILADKCYYNMFSYCKSLNEMEVLFSDDPEVATNKKTGWGTKKDDGTIDSYLYTNSWVISVASNGTFRAPQNLYGINEDANDTKTHNIHMIPKGWNWELGIIATIPDEEHKIPTGYSFVPEDPAIILKSDYAYSGEKVLYIPAGTTSYTLKVPSYATVRSIKFEGTTATPTASSITVSDGTKKSSSNAIEAQTSNAPSTVRYDIDTPVKGKEITFTIANGRGFYGVITLYGDIDAHISEPTIEYDYKNNILTIAVADEDAKLYYSTNGSSYTESPSNVWTKNMSSWANEDSRESITYYAKTVGEVDGKEYTSPVASLTIYRYSPIKLGYCLVDDTEDLVAALNYANHAASSTNRVKVFVPNGTYDLGDKGIEVGSYVSLIGEDIANTQIKNNSETYPTVKVTGFDAYLQDIDFFAGYPTKDKEGGIFGIGAKEVTRYKGCAIENTSSNAILKVAIKNDGDTYRNKYVFLGKDDATLPAWNRATDEQQKTISRIACNGSTLHVICDASAYLVKGQDGDFALTDSKDFYIMGGLPSQLTVRAANSYGGFGESPNANITSTQQKPQTGAKEKKFDDKVLKLNANGYASFSFAAFQDAGDAAMVTQLKAIGAIPYKAIYRTSGAVSIDQLNPLDIVPSETGVIFFGAPGSEVHFYRDNSDISGYNGTMATNELKANCHGVIANPAYPNVYVLKGNEIKRLAKDGTIGNNKAYFNLSGSGAATLRILFDRWNFMSDFEIDENGEETSIIEIPTCGNYIDFNETYTLTGIKTTEEKGLLIKNGKVVLQK